MTTVLMRVDDLNKEVAAETVRFGLDGADYEIDLTAANAAELRAQLRPFLIAARPTGRTSRLGPPRRRRPSLWQPGAARETSTAAAPDGSPAPSSQTT